MHLTFVILVELVRKFCRKINKNTLNTLKKFKESRDYVGHPLIALLNMKTQQEIIKDNEKKTVSNSINPIVCGSHIF